MSNIKLYSFLLSNFNLEMNIWITFFLQTSVCHCLHNNPCDVSFLSLHPHVNSSPPSASPPSCPVRCFSPPPPEPLQLLLLHIFALSREPPAILDPARLHTGARIDAAQLFPNPTLDFDPLPFLAHRSRRHFWPPGQKWPFNLVVRWWYTDLILFAAFLFVWVYAAEI